MKKSNLLLSAIFVFFAGTFLFSCNNAAETAKTDTTKTTADTTKAVAVTPAPPAFTPFDVMEIIHTVKDYAKWRHAFNTDSTARRASGLDDIIVGKADANPHSIIVVLKASDIAKAKAFAADPRLKDVMQKNGVTSKPDINYWHIIRFSDDTSGTQWVQVTHKVKDFDAWVKVFDGEGTATRASFGLKDIVLSRGVDDPNIVHLVFDITDMAKAKARMADPALKKLMTDAGVEGAPKIEFYSVAR